MESDLFDDNDSDNADKIIEELEEDSDEKLK